MNQKFLDFLNEYLPAMDMTVPTQINMGGCGIFAIHFSEALDKMQIPHKIVAMYEDPEDEALTALRKYLKKEKVKMKDVGEDHIMIQIDNYFFDSDGVDAGAAKEMPIHIEISKDVLIDLIARGDWRGVFDKGCEPQIISYLNAIPEKFKEWHEREYPELSKDDIHHKKVNQTTKNNMRTELHRMPEFELASIINPNLEKEIMDDVKTID